jgi:hypothetical protein
MRQRSASFIGLACFLVVLVTGALANAANVLNVTGPDSFGFANQIVQAEGWNQTVGYSNVTIVMPLADFSAGGPIGGVEGTVYLMNQIGPGTTAANEVAPPVTISGLTASFTPITLFTGLTLPPGNYYLVTHSTSAFDLSMSPEGSGAVVVTPGVGVAPLGSGAESDAPAPYPPATDMNLSLPGHLFVTVTGDLGAPVPTLGTVGLGALLLILAGAALLRLRRRSA